MKNKNDCILSIDLGGTDIKIAIMKIESLNCIIYENNAPKILALKKTKTRRFDGPNAVISQILQLSDDLTNNCETPFAIGLSVPGTVDSETKTLIAAPLLKGFINIPIGKILNKELGLPVYMDNDANSAALAEAIWGNSQDAIISVYLTISTGFGMGVVIDKKIYKGAHNIVGEPCHVSIWKDGDKCEEGHNGCLEAYVTGTAISMRGTKLLSRNITTEDVFNLANGGDKQAKTIINDAAEALSVIISLIQTILDPNVIVLGGGVIINQPNFFDILNKKCKQSIKGYPEVNIDLRLSKFKKSASLIGAAALCFE